MGLKDLLGGDKGPVASPRYERVHRWIESRIGPVDYADPNTSARLEGLLAKEKAKYPSPRGRLSFTPSGDDTVVTGDTRPFKGRLKRLGLRWDRRARAWIGRGKQVGENDLDTPSQISGLKRYIETVAYRAKFGDQGKS